MNSSGVRRQWLRGVFTIGSLVASTNSAQVFTDSDVAEIVEKRGLWG